MLLVYMWPQDYVFQYYVILKKIIILSSCEDVCVILF